jgi:hypothetical protein
MARRDLLAVVSFIAAAQLLGCGGSSSSNPQPPLPHTSASVPAATGGTVSLPGGAAVQIPGGALAADATITIQQSTVPVPTGTVGAVYDLGPSGTTFSLPVTITIPVPAGTADAAIWTKPAGAAHYTSLPTAVSGGVATAQASHFSVFLVGPVDLSGTWAGLVEWATTTAGGLSGPSGSTMQSRDVTQDVGDVTLEIGAGDGASATCAGTISGAVLSTSCTLHKLDGSCTAQYAQGGSVTGSTWYLDTHYQWTGTCPAAGWTVQLQHSPVTRQPGPARNIAGTYDRTTSFTMTGPGKAPYAGSGTGTAIRTQTPGSSLIDMTYSSPGGATYTCKGVVIGDTSYGTCIGSNGATRYQSTGQATITSAGPPMILDGENATSIYNDSNGYTSMTGTYHDVHR